MDRETVEFFEHLFDSLKREIHQEFADLRMRLDRMEVRQDRQGALIQNGARWVTRTIGWSEKTDRLFSDRDRRMQQLEERTRKLEEDKK